MTVMMGYHTLDTDYETVTCHFLIPTSFEWIKMIRDRAKWFTGYRRG